MKGNRVASRYAKSLLSLADEQGQLEAVYADMSLVAQACGDSRDLVLLLKSPIVKPDKKAAILNEVFGGRLGDLATGFIKIITSKKREYLLESIANEFLLQYKAFKGITIAELTSAVQLDEAQKQKILNLVGASGEIEVVEKIDPELIGGFIVRVGDKQVDTSVSRTITSLKKEFDKNLYVAEY